MMLSPRTNDVRIFNKCCLSVKHRDTIACTHSTRAPESRPIWLRGRIRDKERMTTIALHPAWIKKYLQINFSTLDSGKLTSDCSRQTIRCNARAYWFPECLHGSEGRNRILQGWSLRGQQQSQPDNFRSDLLPGSTPGRT